MELEGRDSLPVGLCITEGAEVELGAAESLCPELPLDGGDGKESSEGLCWLMHWATAKPVSKKKATVTREEVTRRA